MQRVLVSCCLFLLTATQVHSGEQLFSFEKNTGQRLTCPVIEGTIEDPVPGGFNWGEILNEGDGSFSSTCIYFVKTGDNEWTSVVTIYTYWIAGKKGREFDCKWADLTDTERYTTGKTKQAYVETNSCDPEFSHLMPAARENLLHQVIPLAMPCQEDRIILEAILRYHAVI